MAAASINASNDTRTRKVENTVMQAKSETSNLIIHDDGKEPQTQELTEQGEFLNISVTRALYAGDPHQPVIKTLDDFNPQLKEVREIAKIVDGLSPSTVDHSPEEKPAKSSKPTIKRRPVESEQKIKVELNPQPTQRLSTKAAAAVRTNQG